MDQVWSKFAVGFMFQHIKSKCVLSPQIIVYVLSSMVLYMGETFDFLQKLVSKEFKKLI